MTRASTKQRKNEEAMMDTVAGSVTTTETDRASRLAERRAAILERSAAVRAKREATIATRDGEGDSRFYDPDDYGNVAPAESVESDVGWLPLDGRPR